MSSSRITTLLKFLKEDPNDAFTLYALATEYRKEDVGEARYYYEKLLSEHPRYVATYYHAASLYIELGNATLAEQAYKKGIEVAREQREALALRELQSAYNEFMFDE